MFYYRAYRRNKRRAKEHGLDTNGYRSFVREYRKVYVRPKRRRARKKFFYWF